MEKQWDYSRCLEILNQEIGLLKKIYAVQNAVREAVFSQEWTDFEWKMAEIKQIGTEFGQLDDERASLFASLAVSAFGLSSETTEIPPFYTIVARLPDEERRELSRLYRIIKLETLRMQSLNGSFIDYLNEARTSASAYLETAFPFRWGKVYTNKGDRTNQDLKSIVLNRHI